MDLANDLEYFTLYSQKNFVGYLKEFLPNSLLFVYSLVVLVYLKKKKISTLSFDDFVNPISPKLITAINFLIWASLVAV